MLIKAPNGHLYIPDYTESEINEMSILPEPWWFIGILATNFAG